VGAGRLVMVAPVMVPPLIVAVEVNVPLIVAPAIIGDAEKVFIPVKVCAAPVPTMSPVTP
jgi:hypothetical protein